MFFVNHVSWEHGFVWFDRNYGILTIVVARDKVTGKVTILARKNSQLSFVASDKITRKKSPKSYSFGLDKFI